MNIRERVRSFWREKTADFRNLGVLKWVFLLLWKGADKKEIYKSLLFALIQALLLMIPPIALAELNNIYFQKQSRISDQFLSVLSKETVLLMYCAFIAGTWYFAFYLFNKYTYYSRKLTDATQAKYQHEIFGGMLWQDLSFHKQNRAAGVQSQVQSTSKSIYRFIYSDLTVKALLPIISIPIFAAYIIWGISWYLIFVSIVPFFYVLYLCFTIAPKISAAEQKSWNVVGETAEYCLNRLQNYRVVKMFRNEQYEIDTAWENFQEQLEAQHDSNVNWRKLTNRSKSIGAIFMVVFIGIIALGSHWGWYAVGVIISAVWYYIRMFDSFIDICFTYTAASTMAPQLKKVEPYLIESKFKQENKRVIEQLQFRDAIEFKDVHFSHPALEGGEPVKALYGINCRILKGQRTVVVGENGSGKSTFIDLLSGMDKPESGEILIDGVDTKNYSDEAYAKLFAAAWQKTLMFRGTIKNNLMYARPGITMDEIEYTANRVGIHDKVMRLSQKYDTMLGDINDPGLSGGQMQRLQLVRALLADRQVLILDEPTSGLDTVGIDMIWGLIDEQTYAGRTVVMISHKPEDMSLADNIIILNSGQVIKEEHKGFRTKDWAYTI